MAIRGLLTLCFLFLDFSLEEERRLRSPSPSSSRGSNDLNIAPPQTLNPINPTPIVGQSNFNNPSSSLAPQPRRDLLSRLRAAFDLQPYPQNNPTGAPTIVPPVPMIRERTYIPPIHLQPQIRQPPTAQLGWETVQIQQVVRPGPAFVNNYRGLVNQTGVFNIQQQGVLGRPYNLLQRASPDSLLRNFRQQQQGVQQGVLGFPHYLQRASPPLRNVRMRMTVSEYNRQPPQRGNAIRPPPRRQITNSVYDPAYEAMGLPVDPHLRALLRFTNNDSAAKGPNHNGRQP